MKDIRSALVTVILLAIAAKVVWWAIEPALPAVLVGILLIFIYALIFRRKW